MLNLKISIYVNVYHFRVDHGFQIIFFKKTVKIGNSFKQKNNSSAEFGKKPTA